MIPRTIFAFALLSVVHFVTSWVYGQYGQVAVISPTVSVNDLPITLGKWEGVDSDANKEVFEYFDADSFVNRIYRNSRGEAVALHIALFTDRDKWAPHHPPMCYTRSGWEVEESAQNVFVESEDSIEARLMMCHRLGDRVATLYWYQMGDLIYFDRDTARDARRELFGAKEWPPIVKVLLQTQMDDPELAKQRLADIASKVRDWTVKLKTEADRGS